MKGFVESMIPDGHRVITDQTECVECGDEPYGCHFDENGDLFCNYCYSITREDTVKVDKSVVCVCGNETHYRKEGDWSGWLCPHRGEVFSTDGECTNCGREGALTGFINESGEYCEACIRERDAEADR